MLVNYSVSGMRCHEKHRRCSIHAMPSLGNAIRDALSDANMSQNELARRVGRSPATMNRWINGQDLDQFDIAMAIEDALELPRGHLFIAAGYVDGEPLSVRDAIATDPDLPANLRQIVLTTYDSVIQSALAARS